MDHYDTAWKRVFDLPLMVEHLVLGHLPRAAAALDLGTLRMLSPQSVDSDHRRLEGDMLWRVDYADGSGRSLVLAVEFQSAPDADMDTRIMRYEAAAVERLRKHVAGDPDRLLRTLAVVLHTGRGRWTAAGAARPEDIRIDADGDVRLPAGRRYVVIDATAARNLRDRRDAPAGADRPRPVDGAATMGEDAPQWNLATTLFELNAAAEVEDMAPPMRAMAGWLDEAVAASAAQGSAEDAARGLLEWLRALAPRMFADAGEKAAAMVEELTRELLRGERKMTLLAERVEAWETGWKHEGMAQGLAQGRDEGLAHQRRLLARHAGRKFGGDVSAALAARLAEIADFDRLDAVDEWIVACRTGGELLRRFG